MSHRDPTHLKKQHGELSEGDNECPPTPSTCTCVSVHGQKARASTQTHICNLEKSHLSDTQAKLRLLRNNEYSGLHLIGHRRAVERQVGSRMLPSWKALSGISTGSCQQCFWYYFVDSTLETGDRVSYSPGWPQAHQEDKEDLEVTLLSPPPEGRHCSHGPSHPTSRHLCILFQSSGLSGSSNMPAHIKGQDG